MKDQLKALSKETLIYGLSTVLGRFLNFLLVPFYVNVLHSTVEYGVSTSLYTYIGFLNVIFPLGLEAAYFRFGARAEGEPQNWEKEKVTFSSPFNFLFLFSTCLALLLIISAPWLVKPVFFDSQAELGGMNSTLVTILRCGAGILFFDCLSVLPFAVLRLEHQALRFSLIRFFGILLTLVLNFIFILKLEWGVKGIFIANLIASFVVFTLLLPTILPRHIFSIQKPILKVLLPFGLTNVPAYLSSMMVQVIDRPIVQSILGLGMLGVYQANYRMGFAMMVLVSLFEYAWRPFFMRQYLKNEEEAKLLFARVFTYFNFVALFAFLLLSWILPYIVRYSINGRSLLKFTYWEGLGIIPVILMAYVFQGMYTNFIVGIYVKNKNKALPVITGVGALINIGANLILIPRFGIQGAAWATLMAYFAMAFFLYCTAQKVYAIPYEWDRIRFLWALILLVFVIERFIVGGNVFLVKIILLAGTFMILFSFGFFKEEEKNVMSNLLRWQK